MDEEDRLLRTWTPRILRTILIAASLILVAGIAASAGRSPHYYVGRFRAVQSGDAVHLRQDWVDLARRATHGDPHSIMTLGLCVLTLVPLARVAFCFVLFIRQRDGLFIAATAYVLAALILGVMLGRIG
jgi:hypothetical protein